MLIAVVNLKGGVDRTAAVYLALAAPQHGWPVGVTDANLDASATQCK
ncbi:MAG: hypothetical protein ACYC19_08855 [Acidimicrobiales bacterium]